MKHDMDDLLKYALSSKIEPDDRLNQEILKKAWKKEAEIMGTQKRKRIPAAVALAVLVLSVGSFTVYAAWKYLTPGQVAEVTKDKGLAAAFNGEDAVAVHEVQEYGNYRITLLGIVSGRRLSEFISQDGQGNVYDDRTYVVTAIEHTDGTPRPDTSEESYGKDPFFISPLIEGLDPAQYNIVTMNGCYSEIVEDGIQYRIAECDNVEIFADREIFLCVSDGTFYNTEAYQFDKESGAISRNESYQGTNALFTLPLEKKKADKRAAEDYIREMEMKWKEDGAEDEEENITGERSPKKDGQKEEKTNTSQEDDFFERVSEEISDWKKADFEKKASLVKEMILTPDTEGNLTYEYQVGEDGAGSSSTISVEMLSEKDEEGMAKAKNIFGGQEKVYIETFLWNEDGTITLCVYQMNPSFH